MIKVSLEKILYIRHFLKQTVNMLSAFKKKYLGLLDYNYIGKTFTKLELRQYRSVNLGIIIMPPILLISCIRSLTQITQ
jgi:hypothetical protein